MTPLYDDRAPIACAASAEALPVRIDQIERLRTRLSRVDRTPDGILLWFPNHPGIQTELSSFTVEEKGCCAFWGFAVTTEGGEVVLRWEGPPTVQGFFEELVALFESDDP